MKLSFKLLTYLVPYILFGVFNYYFAKEAVANSSPFSFNLIRYVISALIFFSLGGRLTLSIKTTSLSILSSLSSLLWAYGLLYVRPSESAVLSYSMPLFAIPLSIFFLKEKSSILTYLGAIIGFCGVAIYGIPLMEEGLVFIGVIYTVINAVFWAGFSVAYRALKNVDPLDVNFTQFLLGSAFFGLGSLIDFKVDFNMEFLAGIIYTSTLGGALLFLLWNLMLRVEKVAKVTVLTFSIPIVTTALGVLSGDVLLPIQLIGIALMLLGIVLSRLKEL